MLSLLSGILAEAIIIVSSSLRQKQSIFLTSLLQCPHFRSSRPELFCKKDAFENFAKFTGVSCEFCKILKNTFFLQNISSGCFWHFRQSRFPILVLYIINRQLRREYEQFFPLVERKASFSDVFLSE